MLDIVELPQSGGGWYKPADHDDAIAILVEVKDYRSQVPTQHGPKDTAWATLTIFKSEKDLDFKKGKPVVLEGVSIQQTYMAQPLAALIGKATILKNGRAEAKPGKQAARIWDDVDSDIKGKVIEWAKARQAEREAAIADAPDF